MTEKDWILLIFPILINSIFSIVIIFFQNRLNIRIKKVEKSQSRKDLVIDEYLKILTELSESVFITSAKLKLGEDIAEMKELKERTNALTAFINNNRFLLKGHIERVELIRAKCGYSLCNIDRYIELDKNACEDYSLLELIINDLKIACDTIQELKKEAIDM